MEVAPKQEMYKVILLTIFEVMWYSGNMDPYQTRSVKETREQLSQLIEEVAVAKRRYMITKFGKPKAMIIPIEASGVIKKRKTKLAGFGMWKDRKDMKDPAQWVARKRKLWSSRLKHR